MRVVTDDQGRVLTDGTGQEVGRHDFEPFGEEVGGPSVSERRLFTSAERDFESGFDYLGARFYWPELGRFTTGDPAGLLAENLYTYVMNDPLMFIDPTGMQAQMPAGNQKKREDPPIFKVTIIGHVDDSGVLLGFPRTVPEYEGPTLIGLEPGLKLSPNRFLREVYDPRPVCEVVFLQNWIENLFPLAPSAATWAEPIGRAYQMQMGTKALQHALDRGLSYPQKSSVFRNLLKNGARGGALVVLVTAELDALKGEIAAAYAGACR